MAEIIQLSFRSGSKKEDLACSGCRRIKDDWSPPIKDRVSLPKKDPIDKDENGFHLVGGRAVSVFKNNFFESVHLEEISENIFVCVFKIALDMKCLLRTVTHASNVEGHLELITKMT